MSVSEPFIRRPVATTLVMAALLLFGAAAYQRLPVSDLPNVDFPTLLVSATLPGANPDTMASSVATPIRLPAASLPDFRQMPSSPASKPPLIIKMPKTLTSLLRLRRKYWI